MITYKIDKDKRYLEDIRTHLGGYNTKSIGEKPNEIVYYYIEQNSTLVAAVSTHQFWDWITINDLYYPNLESLKQLIQSVCETYKDKAVGIRFYSNLKPLVEDLKMIGFTQTDSLKYSPLTQEYYFLEHRDFDIKSNVEFDITVQHTENKDYSVLLHQHLMKLKSENGVTERKKEILIVALDGEKFAGGVLAFVYEDYVYIDLLVVNETYRGLKIGSTLMHKIETELNGLNIVTISLETGGFQARQFYEKIGYKLVSIQSDFPRGFSCYSMQKGL